MYGAEPSREVVLVLVDGAAAAAAMTGAERGWGIAYLAASDSLLPATSSAGVTRGSDGARVGMKFLRAARGHAPAPLANPVPITHGPRLSPTYVPNRESMVLYAMGWDGMVTEGPPEKARWGCRRWVWGP
jgi:hypothetical protein